MHIELGIDIRPPQVLSPFDPAHVDKFAHEYERLRAHKGVTYAQAADSVTDVSYFGTLMVHLGLADGMVSGAAHTTAHTIRPAFEIIKTKPGVSVVSSVFLMALADRVLVYGDCAVIPDPTGDPARRHRGVLGRDRSAVRHRAAHRDAVVLDRGVGLGSRRREGARGDRARPRARPELLVEGPIQYDAAADAAVAEGQDAANPLSRAGRPSSSSPTSTPATTPTRPCSAPPGAVAIGPVLQGLNKPINDLSRGALVDDIVNTIAITAIQAQGEASR